MMKLMMMKGKLEPGSHPSTPEHYSANAVPTLNFAGSNPFFAIVLRSYGSSACLNHLVYTFTRMFLTLLANTNQLPQNSRSTCFHSKTNHCRNDKEKYCKLWVLFLVRSEIFQNFVVILGFKWEIC
jgi:hypothetical protein